MAKIIYMSDSPTLTTGYGRVGKELLPKLIEAGHEVEVIGWGYNGEPHDLPYKIIPCNTYQDRHGEDILANYIKIEKPDILFTLGDPWMTEYIPSLDERYAVVWMSYFPIDGYPVPENWHNWIRNIDVPVTFSRFAFDKVAEILGKNPLLIYHGVDLDKFYPIDKQEAKRQILNEELRDKFVIGTVARNQPRKNLPALIKGFAQFAKNRNDAILYLHTQVRDVGWNIDELVRHYKIEDKVLCTQNFNALKGVPDSELNVLYNMFDLFCLPTMSEGFGLPIMEAQACGTPVMVTDFSACSELVVNKQQLIRVKDTLVMGRNIEQAIADTDDIAHKLSFFYGDWKRGGKQLKTFGELGRKKAVEQFNWADRTEDFVKLINHIAPQLDKRSKAVSPTFTRI